jgi:hypothetical protein
MSSGTPELMVLLLFLIFVVIATVPNYVRRNGLKAYAIYFACWIGVAFIWAGVSRQIIWP